MRLETDFERKLASQAAAGIAAACDRMMRDYAMRKAEQAAPSSGDERLSLLEWGRKYLPEYFMQAPSRMHQWLGGKCDQAGDDRGQKLNVLAPRGGAKSTLVSLAYPLRRALEGREPYIWIISETKEQAQALLGHIKDELENNELLAYAYPGAAGRGPTWRVDKIVMRNGVVIDAFGTGQKLRGRRSRQNRPTLVLCDDLQSDNVITSPPLRAKHANWFHGTVLKAGSERTNFFNVATALHRDALGFALTKTPGWTSKVFRAIEKWPDKLDLWDQWEAIYHDVESEDSKQRAMAFYRAHKAAMDAGARLLWPERESLYALMCMRAESGRTSFEREKQSRPINPDECEWGEEYFGDWIWYDKLPADIVARVVALDPSKGKQDNSRRNQTGDYSAYVMLAIDRRGHLYADADLARRPINKIVSDGVAICRHFGPTLLGVEGNAWQELLCGQFADAFTKAAVVPPLIYQIDNTLAKVERIRRLDPWLAARRLHLKANSPGIRLLLEQVRDFPLGDHDDGPDALEMAIRVLVYSLGGGKINDGIRAAAFN